MASGVTFVISFLALIISYIIARVGKGSVRQIFKIIAVITGLATIISVCINLYDSIVCTFFSKLQGECGLEPGGIADFFALAVLAIILIITLVLTLLSIRTKTNENNTTS